MNPAPTPGFTCYRVSKLYPSRNGEVPALENVTFSVQKAEFVCIVGPSGCGKSTLLKLLAGLLEPSAGELRFSSEPAPGQPRNALVFQEHGLFPWMTVLDNATFGLEMQGVGSRERQSRGMDILAQVGIAGFARHYPHELSMGMRQRAAIARALLSNPLLLLMDEPFSSLDAQSRLVMQEELLRIWRDHQQMVVFVTHDIEEAVLLGDRVLVMTGRPGRIQEEIHIPLGRPRDLQDRDQPQVREIRWHIWKAIEQEVRRSLQMPA